MLDCYCRLAFSGVGAERAEACIAIQSDVSVDMRGEGYDERVGGAHGGQTLFAFVSCSA